MKMIDEPRLDQDLAYRFDYLTEFTNFTETDVAAIQASAAWLAPLVSGLVDAVYEKLFTYDATARHFMPQQHGFEGQIPTNLQEITHNHPLIQFRKQHLARYLTGLVTRPYDAKMVQHLDMVGKIHTSAAGNPQIQVPLIQMNALLTFVSDAITAAIFSAGLERETEVTAIRAFQKLLWLQNDLISRHYVRKSNAI